MVPVDASPPYFFYAMRLSGLLKIGITKSLKKRMGDYTTHNPTMPVEVIFARGSEFDIKGLESHFKGVWAGEALHRTEWFPESFIEDVWFLVPEMTDESFRVEIKNWGGLAGEIASLDPQVNASSVVHRDAPEYGVRQGSPRMRPKQKCGSFS